MRVIQFTQTALEEMNRFKSGNQHLVFKIFELISDIQKNPFSGMGKPEPLRGICRATGAEELMMSIV